jgi:acetyl-CoA C-acetyltransferase
LGQEVAIVGIGRIPCEAKIGSKSLNEIIFQVSRAALDDAGIEREAVDNVVLGASDQLDGRAISSMVLACPAGAYLKDEIKVCQDGSTAVAMAYMRLASKVYDVSLVVSWTKCSESPALQVSNLSCEPFFNRPIGLNYITTSALQVGAYAHSFGVTAEDAARVIIKNRANGVKNPFSHLKMPVTEGEIKKSPLIAWPLRRIDLPPESDGACALVLVSSDRVGKVGRSPVWISGVGWATDTYYLGSRDLNSIESMEKAAKMAYKMAGVNDPRKEIDLIELQEITAYHELMNYEALGLCKAGEGKRLIEQGVTSGGGDLPVNLSGGTLCSNPLFCGGLIGVAEAAMQIRGDAGNQAKRKIRTALAHGTYGFCGQGNTVIILKGQ